MWVRTRVDPEAGIGVDPDRLVNLAHYRSVAVAARLDTPGAPPDGALAASDAAFPPPVPRRWDVVAYLAPGNAGAPEALAALSTELEARAVLARLMDGMTRGAGGLDLNEFAWPTAPVLAEPDVPPEPAEPVEPGAPAQDGAASHTPSGAH